MFLRTHFRSAHYAHGAPPSSLNNAWFTYHMFCVRFSFQLHFTTLCSLGLSYTECLSSIRSDGSGRDPVEA